MKTLNDLLQVSPDCVLFTCVAGSRAYSTHTHESDEDIRGVYAVRADRYLDFRRLRSLRESHREALLWLREQSGNHPVINLDNVKEDFSSRLPLFNDLTRRRPGSREL